MEIMREIIVIGLAIFGLSIGIILNNKPLQGSCGGDAEKCENTNTSSTSI